tara:strand:+ start:56 stop:400 length:345 start_codon:yes stop_codon:yes gene_type:complete
MPRLKQEFVRYMCQFTPLQYSQLKSVSESGVPIAYHVRTAVDNYLEELGLDKEADIKQNSVNYSKEENKNITESKDYIDKYNLVLSLEKIINLKNRGEITEEEYQIFKSKLLEI